MAMARDIAANYKNVDIPPHTPTIFTANAETLDEWMGDNFKDCLPILRRFFVFILIPNPLGTTRLVKKDKLQEHLAMIRKGSDSSSTITTDRMLSLWDMEAEPTGDAAPAVVVDDSATTGDATPAVAVVDGPPVTEADTLVAAVVDSQATDAGTLVAVVVDSQATDADTLAVDGPQATDADTLAVDGPQAPGTPPTSAIIPFTSTPAKKRNFKQVNLDTFTKDQSIPVTIDSAVTPDNTTPGFLALSRGRPDEGAGPWVLDLALFRDSHP